MRTLTLLLCIKKNYQRHDRIFRLGTYHQHRRILATRSPAWTRRHGHAGTDTPARTRRRDHLVCLCRGLDVAGKCGCRRRAFCAMSRLPCPAQMKEGRSVSCKACQNWDLQICHVTLSPHSHCHHDDRGHSEEGVLLVPVF